MELLISGNETMELSGDIFAESRQPKIGHPVQCGGDLGAAHVG